MTKDEFKKEFFELFEKYAKFESTKRGVTLFLHGLTDKLFEEYIITKKTDVHSTTNS